MSRHPCVITLEVSELCVLKGTSNEPLTGCGEESRGQWGDKIDNYASKTLGSQAGKPSAFRFMCCCCFCLKSSLCLCVERLMCIQCPQRPEENMGSPGAAVADQVDLSHLGAGNPAWSSASAVHILSPPSHLSSPTQTALNPEFSSLRFCCMRCDGQVGAQAFAGHFMFAFMTC